MEIPRIPVDEIERLNALHDTGILDTPPEAAFDSVTSLATQIFNVPIALVSLIDHDRQWFKSRCGIDVVQTPRAISFCGHALHEDAPLVVHDALADPRFADNPLVYEAPHIRFYAGVPLRAASGHRIGTLCLVDHVPREFGERDKTWLRQLGLVVETLIQQRQVARSADDLVVALRGSEERHRRLVEQSPDAYFILHDGIVRFANAAALLLLGVANQEQIVGKPLEPFITDEHRMPLLQPELPAIEDAIEAHPLEQTWLRADGTSIWVEVMILPFESGGSNALQLIVRDISARKRYREELERLATHDMLTDLPNRTLLMDRLYQGIARWKRHHQSAIIALINLDHFKVLNDSYGHAVGDQILMTIAARLSALAGPANTVARIGSDEFVLVLEDGDSSAKPQQRLAGFFDAVDQPVQAAFEELTVHCSIGFSCFPEDGTDADALLSAASIAMYRAKQIGRSTIQPYTPELRSHSARRISFESKLRHAIDNHELVLYYQPKTALKTGKVVGFEALVRWKHAEFGMIPPAQFIAIAEESGLIVPIGEWVLQAACTQLRQWKDEGLPAVSVAVNLSALQFLKHDIDATVKRALDDAGVAPHCLDIELTESMAMDNPEKSIVVLNAFKSLGVGISIDDFGTGYSSLSYLKRLPIDTLKIDRSFMIDIAQSAESRAIIQAIIAMAHRLGLKVIAEGVETEQQLAFLATNQCDEVQGHYLGMPMPADECARYLQQRQAASLAVSSSGQLH